MVLQLTKKTLYARWGRYSLAAVVALIVLQLADTALKAKTGAGTVDLQMAASGPAVRFVMDRWQSPADAALAGFLLGFDFLFILLYGVALYFGCVAARERFAPAAGLRRRLLDALCVAPIVAAVCDLTENCLEMTMLTAGPSEILATVSYQATVLKWTGFLLALVLNLLTAAALPLKRKTP